VISISKENIDYPYKVTKVWDTDLINITFFVNITPIGSVYMVEHYTYQLYNEATISEVEASLDTSDGYDALLREAKMQTQGDVEMLKTQILTKGNTDTIFTEDLVIPVSSWVDIDSTYLNSDDYTFMTTEGDATKCADIALTGITSSHRVKGEPEESQKSNLLGKIASYDGGFRIYAKEVPVDTIYIRSIEATKVVT